jgi:hypothetical protein
MDTLKLIGQNFLTLFIRVCMYDQGRTLEF